VCGADGYSVATVRHEPGGRQRLESCVSVQAAGDDQRARLDAWIAGNGARLGSLSTVLNETDYELLLVETPDVRPDEIKAAARWRLKDSIDFPIEEAVVDVFDIPEPARRTGPRMMYAVAARRQAVTRQVELLKAAARQLDVIDIPELALRNVAALLPEATDGLIFLWLHEDRAQILVIKQGVLYLARSVRLDEAPAGDESGPLAGPRGLEAVALELQRSMDYFESHYEQAALTHLVVAPSDERSARFALALASAPETSLRIQPIDLRRALSVPAHLGDVDRRGLLAIGAALRSDAVFA
jgi:MSHA biogenesis protein MshI